MDKTKVLIEKTDKGWPSAIVAGKVQTAVGELSSPIIMHIPEIDTIRVLFGKQGTGITFGMNFTPGEAPTWAVIPDEPETAKPHQINAGLAVIRYFDEGLKEDMFDFSPYETQFSKYTPKEARELTSSLVEKARRISGLESVQET